MQTFGDLLFFNRVLAVAIAASFIAQLAKLIIELVRYRTLNFRVLVETGGMPSSHSAMVTALATGVGQLCGWNSVEFAIATVFAIIVMYDAAGVRLAAGHHARMINQIVDEILPEHPEFREERLKELLGHTPKQVVVGSFLGLAIASCLGPTGLLYTLDWSHLTG